MADSVELIRASTRLHIREVETGANSLGDGRGSHLRTLLLHGVKQFDRTFVQIDRELDAVTSGEMDDGVRAKLRATVAQKFERLGVQLHLAYTLLNTFSASIGRADVPIGLQHLLGTVLSELVSEPSDPIVHPNPIRMYSTKDLVDRLDELLLPYRGSKLSDGYAGPHPIVFNLPALDPSNALLSPIIAHEVGHTAVERKLRADLRARVDADVQAILSKHLASAGSAVSGPLADTWANLFRQWCSELICDAVALVSAGPAFMLAFASFAQPTASPTVGTHPPVRDRIALHLRILDELGWSEVMDEHLPKVRDWLVEMSTDVISTGTPLEAFLREAMDRAADDISAIAREHVAHPLDPATTATILPSLVGFVRDGVPNVEFDGITASPWQIILAGWIAAVDSGANPGVQLIEVVADRGLSDLLIKSVELSSIVTNWRTIERART